ncbi:hypothetical protein [Microvirga aerophila]|uniref:Uncharacterized protein n=1 Tax=Microvirga aerophila TaxID=670291 RepID=A0A512BWM3_9HYPH|nr:hypothetical protein [Microvirga aerophila]GEO16363.1 hypothetical protein MAE02_40590 [Microvirga aerophila]
MAAFTYTIAQYFDAATVKPFAEADDITIADTGANIASLTQANLFNMAANTQRKCRSASAIIEALYRQRH